MRTQELKPQTGLWITPLSKLLVSFAVMDLSSATELEKQLSSKIPKTGGKPDYSDSGLLDVGTGGGWSLAGVVLIGKL